jgi:CHAT domain-containing protein
MRRAARIDPRGSALLGTSRLGTPEVRAALGPNEILLEYFATQSDLYVFLLARDTVVSVVRKLGVDELGSRVRLASEILRRPRRSSTESSVLRGLYDVLVAPVALLPQYRQATELIVVPHSSLTYFPFVALIGPDGKRLVESRSVLTLPSASSLPLLRHGAADMSEESSVVFAPFPSELSGTLEDATAVRAETRGKKGYIGTSATEARLRDALEHRGNVHVASHAVLNQSNPMFSRIELSPGKWGAPGDDGYLDVHELLQMSVRSDLVYLSGCETGAGAAWSTAFRRSQDYATLSQSILYAGAQNVIATLWRIDDLGASVFAKRFYAALAKGSPTDALAYAQRQMISDPRYGAPRYWAGYTISGSGLAKGRSQKMAAVAVQ